MRCHLDINLKIHCRPELFTVTMPLLLNDADVHHNACVAFINGLLLAKPAASFNCTANGITDSAAASDFMKPNRILPI